MNTPSISFLQYSDLVYAARLESACFASFWTEAQFAEAYRQPSFAVYGAFSGEDSDKTMMGYIALRVAAGELEVLNIAVDASFRGKGYSKPLMRFAMEDSMRGGHLLERGFAYGGEPCWNEAFLEVRVSNVPALALYRALGFRVSGIRKGYCSNGEDAYCMTLGAEDMTDGA